MVVIVEHGKIILDRKGRLQAQVAAGSGVLSVLQRTIQSFGRSKKVASGGPDDVPEYPQRLSVSVYLSLAGSPNALGFNQDDEDGDGSDYSSGGEFMEERTSLGCSGGAFTTLRGGGGGGGSFVDEYAKKISSFWNTKPTTTTTTTTTAHVIADRADMYLMDDLNENPLVYPSASSCMIEITPQESFSCSVLSDENTQNGAMITLGWPLMHHSLGFEVKQQVEYLEDGKIPVVNWALQLPREEHLSLKSNNSKLFLAEELVDSECEKLMEGFMTPGASFVTHEFQKELISRCPSQLSGDEFYSARIRFSINMHATTSSSTSGSRRFDVDRSSLLQQKVETLSVDQLYVKFSFEELEVATASFSPTNVVGRGGGSEVYRGELQDGRLVAIKCLTQSGRQAEEELLTDIEINTCLSHSNIVSLIGYCIDAAHLILVYDFLPQGTLDEHLHGGEKLLGWEVRYKVAIGVCKALEYLHDGIPRPVIHVDVKASNILLSHDFQPQLSDFGLAKWAPKSSLYIRCNDVVGTFGYLAPEYFMYGRVNDKTDVYSFGVVLLELITGRTPIDTTRPKGQENLVIWARSLLEERNLEKLVDPRLGNEYNVLQMQTMISVSALCVTQSEQRRPHINQVLKMLLGEEEHDGGRVSVEFDEEDGSNCEGTPNYMHSNSSKLDLQTHLALAMLGVDDDNDDAASESSVDYSSTDLCSKYLEDYLAGSFSRSVSFNNPPLTNTTNN
jgi:serine/threonine protein kinase